MEVVKNGLVLERRAGTGRGELFALSSHVGFRVGRNAIRVELGGAELGALRQRLSGETGAQLERTPREFELSTIGWGPLDVVFELVPEDSVAGAEIAVAMGAVSRRVGAGELALGRSRELPFGSERLHLWRLGPPLGEAAGQLEFPDPDRKPGDQYYARVVWVDGNVAWTSPIQVTEIAD